MIMIPLSLNLTMKPSSLNPRPPCRTGWITTSPCRCGHDTISHTKCLKVFGEAGADGVRKELQQLHNRKIPKPVHPEGLSKAQCAKVLEYLMFSKEKQSGVIKGWGCTDGCPQRLYTGKAESASPTVLMDSVLLTAVIEAQECRAVYMADIPGVSMQWDQDEVIHMVLHGTLATMLIECNPDLYAPYCHQEKGQPVLYIQLMKGLYGCLQAAIQFWKKLTHQLVMWGFVINPYDSCVAKKDVNGSQFTIMWHVDNLKMSHIDPRVLDTFVDDLNQVFGKESPVVVHKGPRHDYLGIALGYQES